ncbi:tyrosine-type recombinase/integrase [Zobellia sp. OII3]|uniref:tyrosine-type recombinase/integrase n=1 Tax=Zobellia sp. OII3 TaxID=2034520 RepID=UPI001F1DFA6F|nr:tyrosine-type recombinase/integrase [Zobellia sp. OII3]
MVPEFAINYRKLERSVELSGKSRSTLTNYARCLSHMALHFGRSPLSLDREQVLDYLHYQKRRHKTPSDSFFKHTVYGLRYLYRIYDLPGHRVALPSIERPKKLPVVLNREEVKLLLRTPKLHKHRLLLALLYGCGLRNAELRNLYIKDIDMDRKQLHIRQGKGRKDRYVPLCDLLIRGIQSYLDSEHPIQWLFNGNDKSGKSVGLSPNGVQWVVKQARQHSGILKEVTTHSLRHTYATHLLEMGMDIMSLKDLLGHVDIQTTMVYLHVSRIGKTAVFSPLEKLYGPR